MAYDGEICMECGFPVKHFVETWWEADDPLWLAVVGHAGGILCPPCFTRMARLHGYVVSWRAVWEKARVPMLPKGRASSVEFVDRNAPLAVEPQP